MESSFTKVMDAFTDELSKISKCLYDLTEYTKFKERSEIYNDICGHVFGFDFKINNYGWANDHNYGYIMIDSDKELLEDIKSSNEYKKYLNECDFNNIDTLYKNKEEYCISKYILNKCSSFVSFNNFKSLYTLNDRITIVFKDDNKTFKNYYIDTIINYIVTTLKIKNIKSIHLIGGFNKTIIKVLEIYDVEVVHTKSVDKQEDDYIKYILTLSKIERRILYDSLKQSKDLFNTNQYYEDGEIIEHTIDILHAYL
jgi:hypothetical protein